MRTYNIKDNHTGSVASEILRYKQTDKETNRPLLLYFKDIIIILTSMSAKPLLTGLTWNIFMNYQKMLKNQKKSCLVNNDYYLGSPAAPQPFI